MQESLRKTLIAIDCKYNIRKTKQPLHKGLMAYAPIHEGKNIHASVI